MFKKSFGRLSLVMAAFGVLASLVGTSIASAQMPWVLVAHAAVHRIHKMQSQSEQANQPVHDFAVVLLQSPADKVFSTVLELARKNPQVMVLMNDPRARRLQVAEGNRVATINVVEFSPEVSQLMIAGTAPPGELPTASRVVATALRVCAELKKDCKVEP